MWWLRVGTSQMVFICCTGEPLSLASGKKNTIKNLKETKEKLLLGNINNTHVACIIFEIFIFSVYDSSITTSSCTAVESGKHFYAMSYLLLICVYNVSLSGPGWYNRLQTKLWIILAFWIKDPGNNHFITMIL